MNTEPNTTTAQQSGPSDLPIEYSTHGNFKIDRNTGTVYFAQDGVWTAWGTVAEYENNGKQDARQLQAAGGEDDKEGLFPDREMLNYLMTAFDSESWECDRCGKSEPTKDMDSAFVLRKYLAKHPNPQPPAGGFVVVPDWVAEILAPGNWRDVHPGRPCKKLSVTYAVEQYQKIVDALAAAPAAQVSPLSGGLPELPEEHTGNRFGHPKLYTGEQMHEYARAALQSVWPGQKGEGNHKLDTDTHVFFYEQDFYVLSNFSAFTLQWKGTRFDTSEAAYHHEKFTHDDSLWEVRNDILLAPSAHEAFKLAERYKKHRRPDWDEVKVGIMREILTAKATQHEYVGRKLLATGDRILVEDSWRDDYWGWGQNRDGQNMLGKLWMEVRESLRATQPPAGPVGGV